MSISKFFKLFIIQLLSIVFIFAQHQNITERLKIHTYEFKKAYGEEWNIEWNTRTGTPSSIKDGEIRSYKGNPLEVSKNFLSDNKGLFGIKNFDNELKNTKTNTSEIGGTGVVFEQYYHDIPVISGGYMSAVNADGVIIYLNGNYYPDIDINTTPAFSSEKALEIAQNDIKETGEGCDIKIN